jgi:cytochrome P450/NADPH-cytochrome P450 reductase
LKNPAAYFKAQEEVDRVVGKGRITSQHLKDLHYLNAVLRETLRLSPTAPAFARGMRRESKEDHTTLGGGRYRIEKGSRLLCLIPKIHRDPKFYGEDANEFKPERMLDENFEKLPKSAWKVSSTS